MTVEWPEWKELINESFIQLIENKDRVLILKGGRGSSKSDFTAKKKIFRCLSERFFRCIVIRSQYNTLQASCYQNLKDLIIQLGLGELFTFRLQPLNIECINGNSFLFRGCDDTNTIKSIKDPTSLWWEEDIPTEEDWITVTSSIRTLKAEYIQEIFSINPEVEGNYQENWFWKRFFKDKPENVTFSNSVPMKFEYDGKEHVVDLKYTVHHSDHTHNKWLPLEYRARLIAEKKTNPYYYTIYTLGHFGNKVMGGLFYKKFNIGTNTRINVYNPHLPLHISFDFNVNPYMSCSIWQMDGNTLYNIDEIACVSPNNDTKSACREFIYRYNLHKTGVFVYGDPSGRNEDTRSEKGFNDYSIIETELVKFNPILRVASMHPPVHMRGMFINAIFERNFNGLFIFINEKSVYLKNDLLFGKEASDGTKLKEKVKTDGATHEKYHHFCFAGSTLITTNNGQKRIDEIKPNDLVLTRMGFKSVKKVYNNGLKGVKTYSVGEIEITCTPNHKFWTKEFSFISINLLIDWITFCIFDEKTNTWKEKLLFTKELNSQDTHSLKKDQKEFITRGQLTAKQLDYTNINLCVRLAKYLKDLSYTTRMKTRSIMIFQTLKLKVDQGINQIICLKIKEKNSQAKILNSLDQKLQNGTAQKKEGLGILKWLKKQGRVLRLFAWNAEQKQLENLIKKVDIITQNTVEINVENDPQLGRLEQKENVYDIEVEGVHEYFANGILVHNSDNMDYLICEAWSEHFDIFQNGDMSNYQRATGYNRQNSKVRL